MRSVKFALLTLTTVFVSCEESPKGKEQNSTDSNVTEEIKLDSLEGLTLIQPGELVSDSSVNLRRKLSHAQLIINRNDCENIGLFKLSEVPILDAHVAWEQLKAIYPKESKEMNSWTRTNGLYIFFGTNSSDELYEIYVSQGDRRYKQVICSSNDLH